MSVHLLVNPIRENMVELSITSANLHPYYMAHRVGIGLTIGVLLWRESIVGLIMILVLRSITYVAKPRCKQELA